MAEPKNFFAGNKFKFTLSGSRWRNNQFELMVTGINIPGFQLGIVNHGTPIKQLERPGDSISFNDVSIEFLISEDLTEWKELFNWFRDLRDFNETVFDNEIVADGTLILLSNKNNPTMGIKFTDMFPYNLSDIVLSLNAADGENQVGEATFKYVDMVLVENV